MLKSKLTNYLLIILTSLFIMLVGFSGFLYIKNSQCKINLDVGKFQCGRKYIDKDKSYSVYIGRIKRFYEEEGGIKMQVNFGFLTKDIPLGSVKEGKILLEEVNPTNTQGNRFVGDNNLVALNKQNVAKFNQKYQGKYVEITLPRGISRDTHIKELNQLILKYQNSPENKDRVDSAKEELAYWKKCGNTLEGLLVSLDDNTIIGYLLDFYLSLTQHEYNQCIPNVYSMRIFI